MSSEAEKTEPINNPATALDREKERRAFFAKAPRQAVSALQKSLPIDEVSYCHGVGYTFADARAYYLYGVLDEVVKASVAIVRWGDFLGDTDKEQDRTGPKDGHLERAIIESTIDEQQMWARKLTEILSDLILFSSTNDQHYYRLYLLCRQLDAYLGLQKDFEEFFACQNVNANSTIDDLCGKIDDIAKKIDIAKVWFLKGPIDRKKLPPPGGIFRSVRERFKRALEVALPEYRLVLGVSYEGGHSVPSRSIHPNIGGPTREASLHEANRNLGRVGLLGIHIAMIAHKLAEIDPKGAAELLSRVLAESTTARELIEKVYQRELDIGDIVFAYGEDLCQVIDKSESKYGYTSYKVRYLTKPIIAGIEEDWFPARYIRLVYPREELRPHLIDFLRKTGMPEDQIKAFQDLSDQDWSTILAGTFTDLEKAGVLKLMLANDQSGKNG